MDVPLNEIRPCWICGDPADSGEHIFKRSDIRKIRGHVSQQNPILLTRNLTQYKIGSSKNHKLKYEEMLCHRCNTTDTQPFDFAWDTFSDFLMARIERRELLRFSTADVFGNRRESDLHLHLYFAKVIGCALYEQGLKSASLRNAIRTRSVALDLGIMFRVLPRNIDLNLSPIFAFHQASDIYSAQCCLDVGVLRSVIVLGRGLEASWPASFWFPMDETTRISPRYERPESFDVHDRPRHFW